MATTSARAIWVAFTETLPWKATLRAAANADSPSQSELRTLALGFNLITPPVGAVPTGVTFQAPAGNVATITLKGVTGDTGFLLHPTDPTSLGLGAPAGTFGLTVSAEITDVRFVWT